MWNVCLDSNLFILCGVRRFQLDQILCKLVSSKLIIFSKHESPTMSLLYLWLSFLLSKGSHYIHRLLWLFRTASFAGHLCHLVVKIQISWHVFSIRSKTMKSPKTYIAFQCKFRPSQCGVFCGFKHLSDKTGILGSCHFFICHHFFSGHPIGNGSRKGSGKNYKRDGKSSQEAKYADFCAVLRCQGEKKKKFLLK